jgi:GWxTD domain-containing protein
MNKALSVMLICLMATSAMAALSPQHQEWGDGPAKWIMTSDEQRAWRKVATDADAVNFIDLFWARRDPSSGTPVNEYRNEFEGRVAYSDQTFVEKGKRGAMTDRGRVYIVLGPSTFATNAIGQTSGQMGTDAGADPTGGRQMGSRHIWLWERADARKFDLPRIEVVFVEDPFTKRIQRDPMRPDFGRAEPRAIKKSIANPDLAAVPEWAPTGGLVPTARVSGVEVHFDPVAPAPAPAAPPVAAEGPAVASSTPGVSRLTLLAKGSINPRSSTDPFAAAQSETAFKGGRDVPWAVQYCSPTAAVPKLKYMLYMAGPTEQRTKDKEVKPERMTSQPGCYVLQGMVPVSKLGPGKYKLTVMIDAPETGDAYSVKGDFSVE